MATTAGDLQQLDELLHQALKTEAAGLVIYETALTCVQNETLRREWQRQLQETRRRHRVLLEVFDELDLDPAAHRPGSEVAGHLGRALVQAMEMARDSGQSTTAELVACECVMQATTKALLDWDLIARVGRHFAGRVAASLRRAHQAVVPVAEERLAQDRGWTRELWLASLGMPAMLPPGEPNRSPGGAVGVGGAGEPPPASRVVLQMRRR